MISKRRAPVLVIGAHRSGTTASVCALELLGLQIGQHLDSHREPRGLQELHEEYLRGVGARWFAPQPFIDSLETHQGLRDCVDYLRENLRRRFGRIFGYRKDVEGFWARARLKLGAPWGWKEPRTTLFAPAWLEIFPDARILHVHRDPMAAAASIRQRELKFQAGGDAPSGQIDNLDYCLRLVETYVAAGERLAGSTHYRRVRFEDIQENPRDALDELANFCGLDFGRQQLEAAAATIRPKYAKSIP
jgi:Sulfotransferase family